MNEKLPPKNTLDITVFKKNGYHKGLNKDLSSNSVDPKIADSDDAPSDQDIPKQIDRLFDQICDHRNENSFRKFLKQVLIKKQFSFEALKTSLTSKIDWENLESVQHLLSACLSIENLPCQSELCEYLWMSRQEKPDLINSEVLVCAVLNRNINIIHQIWKYSHQNSELINNVTMGYAIGNKDIAELVWGYGEKNPKLIDSVTILRAMTTGNTQWIKQNYLQIPENKDDIVSMIDLEMMEYAVRAKDIDTIKLIWRYGNQNPNLISPSVISRAIGTENQSILELVWNYANQNPDLITNKEVMLEAVLNENIEWIKKIVTEQPQFLPCAHS